MFRRFCKFISDLWGEWNALLTGGSIMAIVALYIIYVRDLPSWLATLIPALLLVIATFQVWEKQEAKIASLLPRFTEEENRKKRQALRNELSKLKMEGERVHDSTIHPHHDRAAVQKDYVEWVNKVAAILTEKLSSADADFFVDDRSWSGEVQNIIPTDPQTLTLRFRLRMQIHNLGVILAKLEDKPFA